MCGILFEYRYKKAECSSDALKAQAWRGPDNSTLMVVDENVTMGHNRLAVICPTSVANQPFVVHERFYIVFNGEIYNYKEIKSRYNIKTITESDTEVLVHLYLKAGIKGLNEIVGMFSFVIYDKLTGEWIAARDPLGIKPLYYFRDAQEGFVFASEVSALLAYGDRPRDLNSYKEWKKFRRPVPGYTFYDGIFEMLPGSYISNSSGPRKYFTHSPSGEPFVREKFDELLVESIRLHTVSDVPIASLISGGVDSNVIALFSQCKHLYTTGVKNNNEGKIVRESNQILKAHLVERYFEEVDLVREWAKLCSAKKEPLFVPNEALISLICETVEQKVVLTGEGADELLFGYDRIFRTAANAEITLSELLETHYCYSDDESTDRMNAYLEFISAGKSLLDATEDFFIDFHLTCLLRRMDFASMFRSKEARVPFVNTKLFGYLYRQPYSVRAPSGVSKSVLKKILLGAGLEISAETPKVGFEAKAKGLNQKQHYEFFRNKIMETMG